MSYDLFVEYSRLPSDLGQSWVSGFASLGIEVQIFPGFDTATWQGGFLPFRLLRAPEQFTGVRMPDEAVSGFEVQFEDSVADFRLPMGSPSTEVALFFLGAALLAKVTRGSLVDPQRGETYGHDQALDAMLIEVGEQMEFLHPRQRVHHPFLGWEAL